MRSFLTLQTLVLGVLAVAVAIPVGKVVHYLEFREPEHADLLIPA